MSVGEADKAKEVALLLDNHDELEKMRYLQPGGKKTHYCATLATAFEMMGKIKKELDKVDKYLIWSTNCGKTSDGDTYVFKMSRHHLDMALCMDGYQRPLNGKRSILPFKKCYFDVMHTRVRGFKTLMLWLHHPGMRRMKRLASMDVMKENKDLVVLFFCLFNSALQDYTGNENYMFNPPMFITDEAGMMHQGIHEVFGDSVLEKVSTCQWHFKRCAWHQLVHIHHEDHASFREAVRGICKARTAYEYELYAAMLDEICECNRVTRWWNWWKVWRYHLVPALRGWGWTGTNWAEIGQSRMKPHNRIWLLDAMWEDILHAIVEEADWLNFTKNKGKVLGWGPTLFAKRLNEVKAMLEFGASAIEAIRSACLEPDIEKHFNSDRQFLPAACAKHRVPSSYPKNNPTQDATCGVATKGHGEGNTNGSARGKTSAAHGKSSATHACEKKPGGQNFTGDFDVLDFPSPGTICK